MATATIAVYSGVFGVCVGLVAGFFMRRIEDPAPAAPTTEPTPSAPTSAQVLATLPKTLVVSDVQVIPGRSGWGRPSVERLNVQFERPVAYEPEPPVVPDGDRPVELPDEDGYPRDTAQTTVWARGPLTEQAASLARRLVRGLRGDRHEGWEHGHMHELRGDHHAGEDSTPRPDYIPDHAATVDLRRYEVPA